MYVSVWPHAAARCERANVAAGASHRVAFASSDEQRVVDVFLFFDENDATFNLGGMGGGVSTVI